MERDQALRYLRAKFKVPPQYVPNMPKNSIQMIEKLISREPNDRPSPQELLKSDFLDSDNTTEKVLLSQYTYYMEYPDFGNKFLEFSKECEVLELVNKSLKKVFECHGAQYMETASFKPISNSFTIFINKNK